MRVPVVKGRARAIKRNLSLAIVCSAALVLAGCTVYEGPPPPAYPSYPPYAPYPAYGYYGPPAYSFSFGWFDHGHRRHWR